MKPDGSIEKKSFNAGRFFTYETIPVSNIEELASIIQDLAGAPNKFLIRGQIKPDMPDVVRRKIHDPEAAFDAVPRPWVMLDIDKQPCPEYFDPASRPDEVVKWVQEMLPKEFRDRTCFWRLSSSQNVYPDKRTVSIHLYFWLDRLVSDGEWKRYFKFVSAPVDTALFSPVQPHYTADPAFENMPDPLPNRSGIFKGESDIVNVPEIPELDKLVTTARPDLEPVVSYADQEEAISFLLPYYREGSRDRLCGAIAGTLYRKGWSAENAADLVYRLAENGGDEAEKRYDSALRICDAVDRGLPAQGYKCLEQEFNIDELDTILDLLGVGKPDVQKAIEQLNSQSKFADIKGVLTLLLPYSPAQRAHFFDKITKQTSAKRSTLKPLMDEVIAEKSLSKPRDTSDKLMEAMLQAEYKGGEHLILTSDRTYWRYNGCYWESIPDHHLKKTLLPHARRLVRELEGESVAQFNTSVMNILEGRVYREENPLRQINRDMPTVINCLNGELWYDDKGDVTLKPHKPESYLRHCLNVEYDPAATCPMFDKAALEIFANSKDPGDMYRHFLELAGYICQPRRKFAVIVLLHGRGSNGKTSLIKIIRRLLGENMVMSDRMSDIEGNVFKIGDLDGKLMLLDDDVDAGTLLPDGFLKKISEEKPMTGQHKHKSPFEFTCLAVPVMLANEFPVMSDLSYGMTRRMKALPFGRSFEPHEIKRDLFDEIWEQEASGILNKIVEGFGRLKKRGDFLEPEDCVNAKKEWLVRSNILTTFIDEMCETGDGYRVSLGEFYKAFTAYCAATGVRNVQSLKGVHSRLEGLGYRIGLLNGKRAVWGLKLITEDPGAAANPRM
jgi:P4 family phage/plasmid primase-like protien